MDSVRLEYMRKITQNAIVLSGALRRNVNGLDMGLPVMLAIYKSNEYFKEDKNKHIVRSEILKQKFDVNVNKKYKNKYENYTDVQAVLYRKIKNMLDNNESVRNINTLLKDFCAVGKILIPFTMINNFLPTSFNTEISNFFYNGKTPILYDNTIVGFVDNADNILEKNYNEDELYILSNKLNPEEKINRIHETLKKNRSITFKICGINKNNFNGLVNIISPIIDYIENKFNGRKCVMYYRLEELKTLTDTISITFNKINDAMPIFSSKEVRGFSLELLTYNKFTSKNGNIFDVGLFGMLQIIASDTKDGVISVDGEVITNNYNVDVASSFSDFTRLAKNNTPYSIKENTVN